MRCFIEGCNKEARYKGWCTTHYKRWWRHGDPNKTLTPERGFDRVKCSVEECTNICERANGLCKNCEQRFKRYGRYNNVKADKGARVVTHAGYIILTMEGRRIYEHVHLAQKALGKPLPKGAIVHHMNKKPWDNYTPLNLIICPDQAYHLLLHRRMKEYGYSNEDN